MSLKQETYYTVICDYPGCGVSADEDGEYGAWADHGQAYTVATDSEWLCTDGEGDFCPEHIPTDTDDIDTRNLKNADPTVQTTQLDI